MRFETISIRSMLGLRFRDATTERPVTNGLRVTVRRKNGAGRPTRAVRTVSGAYVAQGLAGLRPHERSSERVPEEAVPYVVEVRDPRGRFVPVLLEVELPYPPEQKHGGLYPVADPPSEEQVEGNGTPEPTVYLFSTIQRPVASGQAVLYADLVVEGQNDELQPAAHAVMEVRHAPNADGSGGAADGDPNRKEVWYGIADAEGRVAVQFPVPLVQLAGSSNGAEGGLSTLSDRTWQLDVGIRYEPSALRTSLQASRPPLTKIFGQFPGVLYKTPDGEGRDTLTPTLSYAEPLTLSTGDRSVLRIGPSSADP
ncbi:MAG: hypothetical protein V5A20_04475 [Salinibacter sp.]|uniref:hypothetical protein n=1 Tax=Salinibacter sp. TaxID=2065818 RepID=UPI002FC39F4E